MPENIKNNVVYNTLSDVELLGRIKKYDSRAIEELYDRYSQILYSLALKITKDKKLSEDTVVDLFAIVWRKTDKFDFSIGNSFTWMVTMARNLAVYKKKASENPESITPYSDEYEDEFIIPYLAKEIDFLDLTSALNLKDKTNTAFNKLTDAQKYVINMGFFEGKTIDEISEKLNIPVETVRTKVLTAIKNLKDNLMKYS